VFFAVFADIGEIKLDWEQDAWFSANGKRLIRVTDDEFKHDPRSCVERIVNV
jgi:very-short-patch-repair endonuclease